LDTISQAPGSLAQKIEHVCVPQLTIGEQSGTLGAPTGTDNFVSTATKKFMYQTPAEIRRL
jgi:hypothetical protein